MPKPEGEFNSEAFPVRFEKGENKGIVSEHEPVFTISESELKESQRIFAGGRWFEKFEDVPSVERADFWVRENGWPKNYEEAEKAAKEAGFEPEKVLEYKIKAISSRMDALSRSDDEGEIAEFYKLDELRGKLQEEESSE